MIATVSPIHNSGIINLRGVLAINAINTHQRLSNQSQSQWISDQVTDLHGNSNPESIK